MSDISDLIDRYWQLGYAEGRENRQHDTETGDAQECRSALDAAVTALLDRIKELERERENDMLRLAVAAVLEADNDFRSQLPKDWGGDPLSDELDGLRRIFNGAFAIRALKSGGANG